MQPNETGLKVGDRVLTRRHGWGIIQGIKPLIDRDFYGGRSDINLGDRWDVQGEGSEEEILSANPLLDFHYLLIRLDLNDPSTTAMVSFFRADEKEASYQEFLKAKSDWEIAVVCWLDRKTGHSEIRVLTEKGEVTETLS